jgi:hypothetical protein
VCKPFKRNPASVQNSAKKEGEVRRLLLQFDKCEFCT